MNREKLLATLGCAAAIVGAFFVGSMSVQKTSPTAPIQTEGVPVRAATNTAKLYGKITKIDNKNVQIRLVEWVEGSDNQEQAALETGHCTLERIEKDECLSNPFFIRETDKTVSLPISSNLGIQVLSPGPTGEIKQDEQLNTVSREIGLTDLVKMLKMANFASEAPFIFTTTGGAIIKIEEQYIP